MKILLDSDPILRQKSESYTKEEITSMGTKVFVNELFNTMFENKGMGIAAPQVGILKRVICVHIPGFSETMFNPVILKRQGKTDMIEGCLSFPEISIKINRSKQIVVKWLDINAKMRYANLDGLAARVVQHEIDHLFGIVFMEKQ